MKNKKNDKNVLSYRFTPFSAKSLKKHQDCAKNLFNFGSIFIINPNESYSTAAAFRIFAIQRMTSLSFRAV